MARRIGGCVIDNASYLVLRLIMCFVTFFGDRKYDDLFARAGSHRH